MLSRAQRLTFPVETSRAVQGDGAEVLIFLGDISEEAVVNRFASDTPPSAPIAPFLICSWPMLAAILRSNRATGLGN
jgi:hypothetical protein